MMHGWCNGGAGSGPAWPPPEGSSLGEGFFTAGRAAATAYAQAGLRVQDMDWFGL